MDFTGGVSYISQGNGGEISRHLTEYSWGTKEIECLALNSFFPL